MKDKEIVYWKTKDGKLVSVDDMDTNHLKNAFKHLIKHHSNVVHQANDIIEKYNALVRKRRIERGEASFNLNGDMANEFNLEFFDEEEAI
jgi:bisphosphoglycerate-independent phosphoglycerate mutase (AlkP superfamily)